MIVSIVSLSITAYLSFSYADEILKERAGDQLLGESTIRGDTIRLLFNTRIEQNEILATDPMIRILVTELNQADTDLAFLKEQKRRDFLTQVQAFQTLVGFSIGFEDVKIVGKHGQVFFSLGRISNDDLSNDPLFQRGLRESFVDFEPVQGGKKMIVASPIFAQDSKKGDEAIGVIISRMRTSAIDSVLSTRSGLGQTGEVYLVNNESILLTESRFLENSIFNYKVETPPIFACFQHDKEMVGFYPDYRGILVYGSSYCAKDLGFVLLAEIDAKETVQPILVLQDRIFQTGLIITLGLAAAAYFLSKSLTRPLVKLKDAANKLAEGDFAVRTNIRTKDEIGQLSYSFDSMAKKLQESIFEIKQKEDVIKQQEEILLNFSDHSENACVCLIDIKDSTRLTADLTDTQSSKLYSIFLNSMAAIIRQHQGIVVKNIGDALLFYFQNPDPAKIKSFKNVLDCCFALIDSHKDLNAKMSKENLPEFDYKISCTYGSVRVAKITKSEVDDIFGSTVNKCAKINPFAPSNGLVIGENMYQIVKSLDEYTFTKLEDTITIEQDHSIYRVSKNQKQ